MSIEDAIEEIRALNKQRFYFICHPKGDRSKLQVVDLQYTLDYEKDDWDVAVPTDFDNRTDAILWARSLAKGYGLTYNMFESRYDSELNEYLGEF